MEKEIENIKPQETDQNNSEEIKKRKFNAEIMLFLILGFLLGVVIKTEAGKRIIIGFEDYKIEELRRDYDLNQIAKKISEREKASMEDVREAPVSEDGGEAEAGEN